MPSKWSPLQKVCYLYNSIHSLCFRGENATFFSAILISEKLCLIHLVWLCIRESAPPLSWAPQEFVTYMGSCTCAGIVCGVGMGANIRDLVKLQLHLQAPRIYRDICPCGSSLLQGGELHCSLWKQPITRRGIALLRFDPTLTWKYLGQRPIL